MAEIPIDRGLVEECRALAATVVEDVHRFIDTHSTVSIERTVLRFLGVEGIDECGVPLVNTIVERGRERGVLGEGIASHLGREMARRGTTLKEAADALAQGDGDAWGAPWTDGARRALDQAAKAALDELDRRIALREARLARLGTAAPPLKYVIVATGNIYDDAKQARAAVQAGADCIAVIRSTAQSLLDYVPVGATTEGYGGTWATQENFRIMREALDEEADKCGRYVLLTNYSSGLCMPEIALLGAWERLDMLLNDSMYGILFRDINMRRTFTDQYVSRLICARARIVINTGEDNYLTTADAVRAAHTVLASLFINEAFAHRAGMTDDLLGLGHAYEIDPWIENSFLFEVAQAQLIRQIFPCSPLKYMPPTKHKTGDIFFAHVHDAMFNLATIATRQGIQLLGMPSEAIHNPMLMDRFMSLKSARYIHHAARALADEIQFRPDGLLARRAGEVLREATELLREVAADGLMKAIGKARFADIARREDRGKGADGVFPRSPGYVNPLLEALRR
jgi:beta-lysine 5,6-aminomutase alpha subunit